MSSIEQETVGNGVETNAAVKQRFNDYVVPNYGRFDTVLTRGTGCYVWDDRDRRYLDMGAGIAVCSLGHAHPAMTQAISDQAGRLVHISNLYYNDLQGRFAEKLVQNIGPGKCFFCNSGAEANEALMKLARKVGNPAGRFEIITCNNSFHGRTMAGISATGQEKVKIGFEPLLPGFVHVPFNDLEAIRNAISPATIAVMIEGIQGEGGINAASPEFLLGLRALCDERGMLLLYDGVQCGHYRTGTFQSYGRILENVDQGDAFLPDAISMAKSLGGGFPLGAVWVNERHADVLGPGTHGTTFGGTPLASAVGLAVMGEIEEKHLDQNARAVGDSFKALLTALKAEFPEVIAEVRGLGLMLGVEFSDGFAQYFESDRPISIQMVVALEKEGMLTIPAGAKVVRFLPPLNVTEEQTAEAVSILKRTIEGLIS
jgi:acetylornithine/N-succinyldiaminopimelate aminotransferase